MSGGAGGGCDRTMKRFWREANAASGEGGWSVLLDGRPVRLPSGSRLQVESRALADAIAAEWRAAGGGVGGEMGYGDVPLTRLAGTAQERIAPDREAVVAQLARYGESDLLCYRADAPAVLAVRQDRAWQPWLDWAAAALGARLRVTAGVVHVAQEPTALAALARAVAAQDAWGLAALGVLVPALGSLVLGLAVASAALTSGEAFAAATVDETYQSELWGEDAEAAARRTRVREDVALAERFLRLAHGGSATS